MLNLWFVHVHMYIYIYIYAHVLSMYSPLFPPKTMVVLASSTLHPPFISRWGERSFGTRRKGKGKIIALGWDMEQFPGRVLYKEGLLEVSYTERWGKWMNIGEFILRAGSYFGATWSWAPNCGISRLAFNGAWWVCWKLEGDTKSGFDLDETN